MSRFERRKIKLVAARRQERYKAAQPAVVLFTVFLRITRRKYAVEWC